MRYEYDDDHIPIPVLVWDEKEKEVYYSCIEPIQKYMESIFINLSNDLKNEIINYQTLLKECSKVYKKSISKVGFKRMKFLNHLSAGFRQNFATQQVGITYDITLRKAVKYVITLLLYPEKFYRLITKFNMLVFNKRLPILWLFSKLVFCNCCFVEKIKELTKGRC